MIERRGRAGFAREASQRLLVAGEPDREELDRDFAAEGWVARDVHLAHPARAERREDLVLPEFLAHHRHERGPVRDSTFRDGRAETRSRGENDFSPRLRASA